LLAQPALSRHGHRLQSAVATQLGQNVFDVTPDGGNRDIQRGGDCGCGPAGGEVSEHLLLACGQVEIAPGARVAFTARHGCIRPAQVYQHALRGGGVQRQRAEQKVRILAIGEPELHPAAIDWLVPLRHRAMRAALTAVQISKHVAALQEFPAMDPDGRGVRKSKSPLGCSIPRHDTSAAVHRVGRIAGREHQVVGVGDQDMHLPARVDNFPVPGAG